MMRPAIGTRVRVLATTGIPGVSGRLGMVAAYHVDGIAIVVRLATGRRILVEPRDVEQIDDAGARDAQPARLSGSAT